MTFALEVVVEELSSHRRGHVSPGFEPSPWFHPHWWSDGSAKTPVAYCRFVDDGEEVGRVKVLPGSTSFQGYTSWSCPPGGATEIDLIEIRPDLRGRGLGRKAVAAIGEHYGYPVIAMSLDETSDPFWRSLGWTAHLHPDDERFRVLFSSV